MRYSKRVSPVLSVGERSSPSTCWWCSS